MVVVSAGEEKSEVCKCGAVDNERGGGGGGARVPFGERVPVHLMAPYFLKEVGFGAFIIQL